MLRGLALTLCKTDVGTITEDFYDTEMPLHLSLELTATLLGSNACLCHSTPPSVRPNGKDIFFFRRKRVHTSSARKLYETASVELYFF